MLRAAWAKPERGDKKRAFPVCVPNKKTMSNRQYINVFIGTNAVWKVQNQILTGKKGADTQVSALFSCTVREDVVFCVRFGRSAALCDPN